MPRKSANQREMEGVVADAGPHIPPHHERPDPPAGMSAAAAAIWTDVVNSMRRGWFSKETHEQLSRYCFAMVECHRLEAALAAIADVGSAEYDRITKHLGLTAARALSYARALRITPVSNRENKNILDARDSARSIYRKPWLDVDDDEPAPKKPWEI
jgi:hypothetical protein